MAAGGPAGTRRLRAGALLIGGAAGAGLAALGAAGAWGAYRQNSALFGPVVGRGAADAPVLYLTFDDGPDARATPAILDTLAAAGVSAAFFMVGRHVELRPALARAVAEAGHAAGNHTFSHVKLHVHGPGRIRRELESAHRAIAAATGREPRMFRAPHGFRNPFVARETRRLAYRTIGWSFGVWDTARPGVEAIRARVRRRLRPGAIILLHDGDGYDPDGDRMQTAHALPGILSDAADAGYRFRPLADLLAEAAAGGTGVAPPAPGTASDSPNPTEP